VNEESVMAVPSGGQVLARGTQWKAGGKYLDQVLAARFDDLFSAQ
jgi:hypothetical protein